MVTKRDIVRLSKKLYEKGFVVANDGNISARIHGGFYITGTGSYFSEIDESQIVQLGKDGKPILGEYARTDPTSELAMHLEVYRQRDDATAVIHAHTPYSTAFSLLKDNTVTCLLTEIKYTLGDIPIAPFARPGTQEVPESIRDLVKEHDAIILSNHGVLTLGKSLDEAYWNLERVEHFSKICYFSRSMSK